MRRKEESVRRILSEHLDPPHLEHSLDRERIFYEDGLNRFNLLGEALNLPFEGLDLSEYLLYFHWMPRARVKYSGLPLFLPLMAYSKFATFLFG
jgi:hypothetical protein